eukprot:6491300-Amphidinium_carterae.2
MDNGTINLSFSAQYFNKILKAYNLERSANHQQCQETRNHQLQRSRLTRNNIPCTDSDWAGCNTTRKSTSGTITSCWGTPLLHISRTQSTIALSSAEAEPYAMGQATIEAQHMKQVIEEMAIPNISPHVKCQSTLTVLQAKP